MLRQKALIRCIHTLRVQSPTISLVRRASNVTTSKPSNHDVFINAQNYISEEMDKRTSQNGVTAHNFKELSDYYVKRLSSIDLALFFRAIESVYRSTDLDLYKTSIGTIKRKTLLSKFILDFLGSDDFINNPEGVFPMEIPHPTDRSEIVKMKASLAQLLYEGKKYRYQTEKLEHMITVKQFQGTEYQILSKYLQESIDLSDRFIESVPEYVAERSYNMIKSFILEEESVKPSKFFVDWQRACNYHGNMIPEFNAFLKLYSALNTDRAIASKEFLIQKSEMLRTALQKFVILITKIKNNEEIKFEEPAQTKRYFGKRHCLKMDLMCRYNPSSQEMNPSEFAWLSNPEVYSTYGLDSNFIEGADAEYKMFMPVINRKISEQMLRQTMSKVCNIRNVWIFKNQDLDSEHAKAIQEEDELAKQALANIESVSSVVSKDPRAKNDIVDDEMDVFAISENDNENENDSQLHDLEEYSSNKENDQHFMTLIDEDMDSEGLTTRNALKLDSSVQISGDSKDGKSKHPVTQFLSLSTGSYRKRRAPPETNHAFIVLEDEQSFKTMNRYDYKLFGITIQTMVTLIENSDDMKTLYVELGNIMSQEKVTIMLKKILGPNFQAVQVVNPENSNYHPVFVNMTFNTHRECWLAYERLCNAHYNGFPVRPRWVKTELYYKVAARERASRYRTGLLFEESK